MKDTIKLSVATYGPTSRLRHIRALVFLRNAETQKQTRQKKGGSQSVTTKSINIHTVNDVNQKKAKANSFQ